MGETEFDLIVFGAGGVTGRRVGAYLDRRAAETGMSWAAAGRDPGRVRERLAAEGVTGAEVIVADVGDPDSLASMCARAGVVLNLVGPYTEFGAPVIEACVDAGTHYLDLTGEIPFARRMLERFGDRAEAAGVKLVQICGFESLPADLSVALAARRSRELWDEALASCDLEVAMRPPPGRVGLADTISGGTAQSMAAVMGAEGAAVVSDPAALILDPERAAAVRRAGPIAIAPRRAADGSVVAPMQPAAFINPAVIHRTATILAAEGDQYALPFRYREGIAIPGSGVTLPLRYAAAGALAGVQAGFSVASRLGPGLRGSIASGLSRVLPDSGFGPETERMQGWSWTVTATARTVGGNALTVRLDAEGHPGYLATARMLGEAGLMLAEPGLTPHRSGFLTPATALGTDSLDRFEAAGLRFTVP